MQDSDNWWNKCIASSYECNFCFRNGVERGGVLFCMLCFRHKGVVLSLYICKAGFFGPNTIQIA